MSDEFNMQHCTRCNSGHPVREPCPVQPCEKKGCNAPCLTGAKLCGHHLMESLWMDEHSLTEVPDAGDQG